MVCWWSYAGECLFFGGGVCKHGKAFHQPLVGNMEGKFMVTIYKLAERAKIEIFVTIEEK